MPAYDLHAQAQAFMCDLAALEQENRCLKRRLTNDRWRRGLLPFAISVMVAVASMGALLT